MLRKGAVELVGINIDFVRVTSCCDARFHNFLQFSIFLRRLPLGSRTLKIKCTDLQLNAYTPRKYKTHQSDPFVSATARLQDQLDLEN